MTSHLPVCLCWRRKRPLSQVTDTGILNLSHIWKSLHWICLSKLIWLPEVFLSKCCITCPEALPSRYRAISVKIVAVWKKQKTNTCWFVIPVFQSSFIGTNFVIDSTGIILLTVKCTSTNGIFETLVNANILLTNHVVCNVLTIGCFFLHILLNTENKNRVKTTAS